MKLAKALDDKKMDVRIVDRLLAEQKISKADYDSFVNSLPDEAGNYEIVETASSDSSENAEFTE